MVFLALGEGGSILMGHFVPGSVMGMLLLTGALGLGWVKADKIRSVAAWLTDNMTVFFIPAFVGIMNEWGIIRLHLWAWLTVVVLTTIVVMLTSGLITEAIIRYKNRKERRTA